MPVGEPGGPDTEMFWDYGAHLQIHEKSPFKDQVCHINCDCGRFVEIGNNVFMEYVKTETGFEKLKQHNVDFGGGLERMLAAVNGQQSVFDTDLFKPLFEVIELSQEIMTGTEVTKARVIVDHIRASVFMAADGLEPANKDRGYILRRLLRRSMVNARLLNLKPHWLEAIIGKVVSIYAESYPDLVDKSEHIFKVLEAEQKKFSATLEKGLREFEKLAAKKTLSGTDAFNLYQTFGFPWELTHELGQSAGQEIDRKEFETEFKKHQELSRTSTAGAFKGGLASQSDKATRLHTTTHLMHKALRDVLGSDVWQKGSHINDERTRFDFTYPQKVTPEQVKQVEDLVNSWIARDGVVTKEIMPLAKARELGAIGLFGEKYAEQVSVYTITDPQTGEVISREFCGGPHVTHTAEIGGHFRIAKEEAVSSGVRRVKGVVE